MKEVTPDVCIKYINEFVEFHGYPRAKQVKEYIINLLKAKAENKMFVLPCSFEDTVYHITTCKYFGKVLDGELWDEYGGYGDATGYYCPYELNDSCPFEDDFEECDGGCECFENTYAIFEDEVEQVIINEYEESYVIFKHTGFAYFSQFGESVFTDKEKAEEKLKELNRK